MSKALGVGVRVYVGWAAEDKVNGYDGRCQTGTIAIGPVRHGDFWNSTAHRGLMINNSGRTLWEVQFDATGRFSAVAEYLLTPLDNGGESETRRAELTDAL